MDFFQNFLDSVLYAPLEVMLLSRALERPEFTDDLPRLDRLRFRG